MRAPLPAAPPRAGHAVLLVPFAWVALAATACGTAEPEPSAPGSIAAVPGLALGGRVGDSVSVAVRVVTTAGGDRRAGGRRPGGERRGGGRRPPGRRRARRRGERRAGRPRRVHGGGGGGRATGDTATTDGGGVATVGAWQLGPRVGENTLAARVVADDGAPALRALFVASGVAGAPARIVAAAPIQGDGVVGAALEPGALPAVTVADAHGNAVLSAAVTFTAVGRGAWAPCCPCR